MALIKCMECGKEISDKASACPNCCAPVEKEKRKVIIEREKGFLGSGNTPVAYIDDMLVGNLKTGSKLETDVPLGEHNLILEYQVGNAQRSGILAYGDLGGVNSIPQKKIIEKFSIEESTKVVHIVVPKLLAREIVITKE